MKIRSIAFSFLFIIATVAILFSACKKINEATELGAGLIPPVDNINTFDTSISIQAFNDTFGLANDSQYLSRNEEFFLGRINTDPFFGKTDARLFLELKPLFYKFAFANSRPDSLHIDSVVLVLNYVETYGDSTVPQTVNVYEIDQSSDFRRDSFYLIRKNNFTYSNLLGSRTFTPQLLDDSVKAYRDTTKNQLRIRLNNSFGTRLLGYDSSATGAYFNDSIFRTKFKGFALQSMNTGEAVIGINLISNNTKLAIYYRYEKNLKTDTTVAYFGFNGTSASEKDASAVANYIKRDYTGTPLAASVGGSNPDPIVYIQNSPGSFATIKIPDLANLSNRLIHRAELIVEQLYDPLDPVYKAPELLYLDAADPSITRNYKFRTIPYDLQYTPTGFDLRSFGTIPQNGFDASGNKIKIWKFNLSRYVQHVLTHTQSLYELRLFAPFTLNESYGIPPGIDQVFPFFVNPTIVKGRVRLGGGNHPTQRMRLRLIYSKL
ncbi:MAG: DUF4270 family protein [Bacteroidota bacterium]